MKKLSILLLIILIPSLVTAQACRKEGANVRCEAGSGGVLEMITDSGTIAMTSAGDVTMPTTMSFSVVAGANTACSTTCTGLCLFGVNTAATEADIVDCADATADECLCNE